MPQLKIPHAATKTQLSQINIKTNKQTMSPKQRTVPWPRANREAAFSGVWLRLTGCPQHPSGCTGPGVTSTGVGPGQVSFGLGFCTTKSLRNLPGDDWSLPRCSPLREGPTVKAWVHVCPHRHTRAHARWVLGSLHVGPRLRGRSFALGAPPGQQSWSDALWTTCSWQGCPGRRLGPLPPAQDRWAWGPPRTHLPSAPGPWWSQTC